MDLKKMAKKKLNTKRLCLAFSYVLGVESPKALRFGLGWGWFLLGGFWLGWFF